MKKVKGIPQTTKLLCERELLLGKENKSQITVGAMMGGITAEANYLIGGKAAIGLNAAEGGAVNIDADKKITLKTDKLDIQTETTASIGKAGSAQITVRPDRGEASIIASSGSNYLSEITCTLTGAKLSSNQEVRLSSRDSIWLDSNATINISAPSVYINGKLITDIFDRLEQLENKVYGKQ